MNDQSLPSSTSLHVDISGAEIIDADPTRETRDIYLPKHTEYISHIAIDIGGSLAKVVYFTRSNSSRHAARSLIGLNDDEPPHQDVGSAAQILPKVNGFLTPDRIAPEEKRTSSSLRRQLRRRSSMATVPGGRLNFIKFETDQMEECIHFIAKLIETSSRSHGVSLESMKKSVTVMATGGGSHLYYDKLVNDLGVQIPNEVYWYSDDLVGAVSHRPRSASSSRQTSQQGVLLGLADLPRPSPNPPRYELVFDQHPAPQYPCLLVNIGSGVSIIKLDDHGHYERISGTSLGGGTLWGLLSMLTGAESFDEMLEMSEQGDNSTVDMLVGDIYGADYDRIGLKSTTIASSFGKVFRKGRVKKAWRPEDISRSLLYAISNNIGQIAYMNAEKHNLDRIYFGGCFIRGHAATMATLSYAIRFWSKGTKTALFLRHEGFLGSIGAWLKNVLPEDEQGSTSRSNSDSSK